MNANINQTTEALFCNACAVKVNSEDQFCNNCGYPLKGTEEEQKTFLMDKNYKEVNLDEANRMIRKTSNTLYYIAGFTLLVGLIQYGTTKQFDYRNSLIIVNFILALIYAGLGFWCRIKPFAAILSAASLYVLIIILNAISNPLTIISGIVFKIVVITLFIRGIKSAMEAEKLKRELNIG